MSTRREALAAIAGAVTVLWTAGRPRAEVLPSAATHRPGTTPSPASVDAMRRPEMTPEAAGADKTHRPGTTVASSEIEPARALPPAESDVVRVRPGGRVELFHAEADAFALSCPGLPTRTVAADGGRAAVRAPFPDVEGDWAALRCVPLRQGHPCGAPAEILVLATPVLYGA